MQIRHLAVFLMLATAFVIGLPAVPAHGGSAAIWTVVVAGARGQGQAPPPITAEAHTATYRLVLQIGPVEKMYSKDEVAGKHPTSGEIMVSGSMSGGTMGGTSMSTGTAMNTRHIEVHVFSLATKQVMRTARCDITVINRATGKRTKVPIATMYGIKEGLADWHYGNNVDMPAGAYDVLVVVNGEQAMFSVTVPAAKM